jgi:hypothetical protein
LVCTRIEASGRVSDGEAIFDVVKGASVGLEPPPWLAVSRVLQKRLKRMKDGRIDRSYGIREYVHFEGAVGLHIEVEEAEADLVADTMCRLRRIGTSDSLLRCISVREVAPNPAYIAQPVQMFADRLDPGLFVGRPVLPLRDIKAQTGFREVDPYQRSEGDFMEQVLYIFPLRLEQQGKGWTRYRREPFESPLDGTG